jgi:ABC-type sugar transport system substrate-binding protein
MLVVIRRPRSLWNRVSRMALITAVLAVSALVAGCGSSSSSTSSSASGSNPSTNAGSSPVAASVNPKVKNKTIGFVDILGSAAVEKRFYKAFTYAADLAGWHVQFVDGQGDPSKIAGAAQNFVNEGVNAIVFNSVPAEMVKPAALAAKAKGIPTINLVTPGTPGTYAGDYDENETTLTPPLAVKLKQDFPHGAQIGLLTANAIIASRTRVAALKQGLAGSGVKIVDDADLPEATPQAAGKAATDMLNANPNLNAIVGVFDQFSAPALAAMKTIDRPNVKYYSFYADSVHVPLMRADPRFAAVVDSNSAVVSFVAVDQLLKHFATGAPVKTQYDPPLKPFIVTKANLPSGGDPDQGAVPFATIAKPFLAQWKTQYGIK